MKFAFRSATAARGTLPHASLTCGIVLATLSLCSIGYGQATQPPTPTRAFQPPTADRAQDAARGVVIVATIGFVGACAILLGTFAIYRPRAWQQPILPPTPIPRADALKEPDSASRAWETADRFDIEGRIGDYLRDQWPH